MLRRLFDSRAFLGLAIAALFFIVFLADGLSYYYSGIRYATKSLSITEHFLTKAISQWLTVTKDTQSGLPVVRLFIQEKSIDQLLQDPPSSTKEWKKGKVALEDGVFRRAKIRIRGDNIRNWGLIKKSWKVKLKKSELPSNKIRTYNLVVPRRNLLRDLIPYLFAQKVGVQVPAADLVEVELNGRAHGVMLRIEQTDENYLRNNGFMPVNIYKAEPDDLNHLQGVAYDDLFTGVAAWRRLAKNNSRASEWSDLREFLQSRQPGIGVMAHNKGDVSALEVWARFAAFQEAIQSWHNARYANQRIIFDELRGTVHPIAWDTTFPYNDRPLIFDRASVPPIEKQIQNPIFLQMKRRYLREWLIDKKIFQEIIEDVRSLLPSLKASIKRDPTIRAKLLINYGVGNGLEGFTQEVEVIIENLARLEQRMFHELNDSPDVSWMPIKQGVEVIVSGRKIYRNLTLEIDQGRPSTISVNSQSPLFLDRDLDAVRSPEDVDLLAIGTKDKIQINGLWVANRVKRPSRNIMNRHNEGYEIQPTIFRIMSNSGFSAKTVQLEDAVTGEKFTIPEGTRLSVAPVPGNTSGTAEAEAGDWEEWSGKIVITADRVVENPVLVRPGTAIRLSEGASLVFLRTIKAVGTIDAPIVVTNADQNPWGSFILQGKGVSGSILSNIKFSGGSGDLIKGVSYNGMLSIIDTDDIQIEHASFANNSDYDDMIRIVYSKEIRLNDVSVDNVAADAIDLDLSEAVIENVSITRSGNDGLDLMGSTVTARAVSIARSDDKGISVGEESLLNISESIIRECNIGLESKDGSQIFGRDLNLVANKIQVNAYKKNWRYGKGGMVSLTKVRISGKRNNLTTDKHSQIIVEQGNFAKQPSTKGHVVFK
jgi:hypothetical protein